MQFKTGGRLKETLDCLALSQVSHPVVGRAADLWIRFYCNVEVRLHLMGGMIEAEVTRTAATLGQTNLVLARAIKDIRVTPTLQSEEGRTE